jgi:hypothetical protein
VNARVREGGERAPTRAPYRDRKAPSVFADSVRHRKIVKNKPWVSGIGPSDLSLIVYSDIASLEPGEPGFAGNSGLESFVGKTPVLKIPHL